IASAGLVAGGRVPFEFLSSSDAETLIVDVQMPIGTPVHRTNALVQRIEDAAMREPEVRGGASNIGAPTNLDTGQVDATATHIAQLFIELHPVEQRDRESDEVVGSIRRSLEGQLAEAERVRFSEISGGPGGADITLDFRGVDDARVVEAANRF